MKSEHKDIRHTRPAADEVERLVEGYFNATLDAHGEERLRRLLADTDLRSESIDEARAVMGIFAAQRVSVAPRSRRRRLWRAGVAAAVALLCVGPVTTFVVRQDRHSDDATLVAWHGGRTLDNPEIVMSMVDSDLALLGEASAELEDAVASDMAALGLPSEVTDGGTEPIDMTDTLNYILL